MEGVREEWQSSQYEKQPPAWDYELTRRIEISILGTPVFLCGLQPRDLWSHDLQHAALHLIEQTFPRLSA